MRRREENNQDNRENTGKMSRLAKSVMAAGLAVGGATAFGDMSVFAAENGDESQSAGMETGGSTSVFAAMTSA